MTEKQDIDQIYQSEAGESGSFELGDLDPSVFDPSLFKPPIIDPDILLPRFQLWVHGVVGMRVLSPTPESAFSIIRRMGGLHVSPSGSGTDTQVNIVFPLPWPPVVPAGPSLDMRRPKPKTAMVLYRTNHAKIRGIVLLEAVGSFGQVIASTSVDWAGNHAAGLDSQNVAVLTLEQQPKFGLAVVVIAKFDTAETGWVHIASVGLEFLIPSS